MSQLSSQCKLLRRHRSELQDCKTSVDRLSELPDFLIEKILLGIPTLDAIKTCVLSKKWQYKWTKLPTLLLGKSFFLEARSGHEVPLDYVHIVNSILIQHMGPLEEFYLVIPDLVYPKRYHISQFIRSVLRRGIKRLILYKWDGQPYRWPSSIPTSPSLTKLELKHCEIKQEPFSRGFQNLSVLIFINVECDPDTLSSCISRSPNLQRVILMGLKFEDHRLSICAPKLVHLYVQGMFKSIYLPEAKRLKEMEIYLSYMEKYSVWSVEYVNDFFGNLNQLESLKMHAIIYKLIRYASYLTVFPRGLDKLRFFRLIGVDFRDSVMLRCFLCFILSSPCLSRLEIVASSVYNPRKDEKGFEVNVKEHYTLKSLRKVYIGPCSCSKTELSVIKVLLNCSPALQEMAIWTVRWPEGEAFSKAIAAFHRASPNVVIDVHADRRENFRT